MDVKVKTPYGEATLKTEVDESDPDTPSLLAIEADDRSIAYLEREIDFRPGVFGHIQHSEEITNLDLVAVISQMRQEGLIEVIELPAVPLSDLPDGVQT